MRAFLAERSFEGLTQQGGNQPLVSMNPGMKARIVGQRVYQKKFGSTMQPAQAVNMVLLDGPDKGTSVWVDSFEGTYYKRDR